MSDEPEQLCCKCDLALKSTCPCPMCGPDGEDGVVECKNYKPIQRGEL